MCGINGKVSSHYNMVLKSMNDKISHRGPDDDGEFYEKIGVNYIEMGMRRLSIIDLKSGKQPITSKNDDLVIVFNGEIYNYQALKQELIENFKVSFKTSSDTEVILKMYEHYGVSSFSRLDGMFAFSVLDKSKSKIFIARDFFGEKPLYYSKTTESFLWGSELKSLILNYNEKPPICKSALSLYFQLTYIPAPHTIYEGIYKLLPNHYLEIDIETLEYNISEITKNNVVLNENIDFKIAKQITHDLVSESVNSRSVSDVPIGTFLSGGVDSSIVSLCLAKDKATKIDTFSMGFDKKAFDETDKSRLVSKLINSNHHEFIINSKSLDEDIEKVILNYDEPFADSSALPTYMVSKLTAKHVKVALTGDGGDEVFGGYNKYYIGKLNNYYTGIVPEFLHNKSLNFIKALIKNKEDNRGKRYKLKRLLESINYEDTFYKHIISLAFQSYELPNLLKKTSNSLDILLLDKNNASVNDFRNIDKAISLEGDMLVKVDRASMLASLECRAPFLNKKIWEFTNSLPDEYLIKGWSKKYLLKQAFKTYFPNQFLDKSKKGFAIPVGDWLRTILKSELKNFSSLKFIREQNIFNEDYIIPLVNDHLNSKEDNTFKVWSFYCFQKWYVKTYLSI